MNDPIDQLTEWWENAEVPTSATLPKDGDRIIIRYNSEWYEIATADGDADEHDLSSYTRILARASKPKPAWHDAVAVIASTDYFERQVWERDTTHENRWYGTVGDEAVTVTSDLRDVTPLIEAKVTEEMVERYWAAMRNPGSNYDEAVRHALAAALGIEERS